MKVTVDVPLLNRSGKAMQLIGDRDTGEVRIEPPVFVAYPIVNVEALARAVSELSAMLRRD